MCCVQFGCCVHRGPAQCLDPQAAGRAGQALAGERPKARRRRGEAVALALRGLRWKREAGSAHPRGPGKFPEAHTRRVPAGPRALRLLHLRQVGKVAWTQLCSRPKRVSGSGRSCCLSWRPRTRRPDLWKCRMQAALSWASLETAQGNLVYRPRA